jgi:glycosyltransferase involved in cell wall biosynthesis
VAGMKDFCQTLEFQNVMPGELRRILYNQELVSDLRRRFEKEPPDFIYERAALYGIAGVALAREFNVPLILELNAPLQVEQSAYRGNGFEALAARSEQYVLGQADAVLAVSTPLREHVLSLGIEASKVQVLPNGVNPALFQPGPRDPGWRARWGIGEELVLGFLGGLRPWHGIEILPELLERLLPEQPGLRLVIAGDGPLRESLATQFRARQLEDKVVFAGSIPHEHAAAVIRHFDIALAPYPRLDHPFYFSPLKLFEYMACGVAVVAADLGQIREVLASSEGGLLYPAGDLDALVRACQELLSDPKRRLLLGRQAARIIQDRFTWDCNARRALEIAEGLIHSRNTPAQPGAVG